MVLHDLPVAGHACVGDASGAHRDEVHWQIDGPDAVDVDEAQELFEVGGDFIGSIKSSVLFVDAGPAIERGVGRHETQSHETFAEEAGGVVADAFVEVLVADVVNISVHGIGFGLFHLFHHPFDDGGRGEKVVGVENAYDIARCQPDTFVHCVIQPVVLFADVGHAVAEDGFVAFDDVKRIVFRRPVHDDALDVFVGLSEYALERVPYSSCTVVCGCDDAYFHSLSIAVGISEARVSCCFVQSDIFSAFIQT